MRYHRPGNDAMLLLCGREPLLLRSVHCPKVRNDATFMRLRERLYLMHMRVDTEGQSITLDPLYEATVQSCMGTWVPGKHGSRFRSRNTAYRTALCPQSPPPREWSQSIVSFHHQGGPGLVREKGNGPEGTGISKPIVISSNSDIWAIPKTNGLVTSSQLPGRWDMWEEASCSSISLALPNQVWYRIADSLQQVCSSSQCSSVAVCMQQ